MHHILLLCITYLPINNTLLITCFQKNNQLFLIACLGHIFSSLTSSTHLSYEIVKLGKLRLIFGRCFVIKLNFLHFNILMSDAVYTDVYIFFQLLRFLNWFQVVMSTHNMGQKFIFQMGSKTHKTSKFADK